MKVYVLYRHSKSDLHDQELIIAYSLLLRDFVGPAYDNDNLEFLV